MLDATEERVLYEYVVDYGTELTLYPSPLNEALWRFTGWLGDDAAFLGFFVDPKNAARCRVYISGQPRQNSTALSASK